MAKIYNLYEAGYPQVREPTIQVPSSAKDTVMLELQNLELKRQLSALSKELKELKVTKVKKPKREKGEEPEAYSEFKSDGKRKARAADSITSYDDFKKMQDYFLSKGKIRDWMLWTVGVSLGLRISDLFNIKIKYFLNPDLTFRKRMFVYEQKTDKLQNCLITEAVVGAITKYFDSIAWQFTMEDYLFSSRKTKGRIGETHGWKILSDAGKAIGLPFVIGSHTMRKSFANIAACVDGSAIDMNSITKIQGLLNHSNQSCTMRYLGTYRSMYDGARQAVSDFVLGKSGINELFAGEQYSMSNILDKLEEIDAKLQIQDSGGE